MSSDHLCGHVHVLLHGLSLHYDDFGGAYTPDNSTAAFKALSDLLSLLGLNHSLVKTVLHPLLWASSVFTSTPLLLHCCSSILNFTDNPCRDLQLLLGVMSFVTACVRAARIFMSSLLHTLHIHRDSPSCLLAEDNKSDLRWWCHFLPTLLPLTTARSSTNPTALTVSWHATLSAEDLVSLRVSRLQDDHYPHA